jgi:uncharacterized membrane-anchored protein
MIWNQESVISRGTLFQFKTAPIDPSDPLRGKYIRLQFEENQVTALGTSIWSEYEEVYATIEKGKDGFARIQTISIVPPQETKNYIKVALNMRQEVGDSTILTISYPFDRYYMEESKAYPAEIIVRESNQDSTQYTTALVHVQDGQAVLTDVQINGISIQEVVQKRNLTE